MDIYLSGLGYGPEDSQIQLKKRLYKNEHIMRQWQMTLEQSKHETFNVKVT